MSALRVPVKDIIRRVRVLVVDADADNRELYRDWFTVGGWEVSEALDGRDALVKALSVRPSIVITELRLPMIDGIALCQVLRHDKVTNAVPILVVTTETHPAELARAERAGASAILIKPSTPDTVMSEVQRLLEQSAPAQDPAGVRPPPRPGRTVLVKAHYRHSTTTPDKPPLSLVCPLCSQPLRYQESFIGGVNVRRSEQWDYYDCAKCGQFQYRHRTRKLRHLS